MREDDRASTFLENRLIGRGVTLEQHNKKMENLHNLAVSGFRVVKAIQHDKYEVKGKPGFYNPYTNVFYGF